MRPYYITAKIVSYIIAIIVNINVSLSYSYEDALDLVNFESRNSYYLLNIMNLLPTFIVFLYIINENRIVHKQKIDQAVKIPRKIKIYLWILFMSFFNFDHLIFRLFVPLSLVHPIALPF